MKNSSKLLIAMLLSIVLSVLFLVSCSSDPAEPVTGRVEVMVYDQGEETAPVAGVSIRVLPADVVAVTDKNGVAVFDLPPGAYTVKADVCCIGPGFIRYDEEASVLSGKTTSVQMNACLASV